METVRARHQLRIRFFIDVNEVLISIIDHMQRLEEVAQINLGASYATRNQVERINSDAQCHYCSFARRVIPAAAAALPGSSARARRKSSFASVFLRIASFAVPR